MVRFYRQTKIQFIFLISSAFAFGQFDDRWGKHRFISISSKFKLHYVREIWKRNKHWLFCICDWGKQTGKSHDYRVTKVFEKLRYQIIFCLDENSSSLKSVFEKLCFREVCRVGLTLEKLRFRIFLAWYGQRLILTFSSRFCCNLQDNLTTLYTAMDSSDVLHPEGPGDEALPLVPLSRSPPLDRRQRAMALSQLSLQSLASNHYDAADTEDDDESVSMATVLNCKRFD